MNVVKRCEICSYIIKYKFPTDATNYMSLFYMLLLTLHVSGPYWPIIRGDLGCLFMLPFGSCSAVVCPCVRGGTDRQQHYMNQMVA
jgi:hypothetical protein